MNPVVHNAYAVSYFAVPKNYHDMSPFTKDGIEANTTTRDVGIYLILSVDKEWWVYVGEGDIRDRLLDHLANKRVLAEGPTHWLAIRCADPKARSKRGKRLDPTSGSTGEPSAPGLMSIPEPLYSPVSRQNE